jgi:hypothetical protein
MRGEPRRCAGGNRCVRRETRAAGGESRARARTHPLVVNAHTPHATRPSGPARPGPSLARTAQLWRRWLRRDWAHPLAATSALGLGSPLPHLHWDWARRCHICIGTGLAAATSAPGLGSPPGCHICTGTRREAVRLRRMGSPLHTHLEEALAELKRLRASAAPAGDSHPGLDAPLPNLPRDWAHPCQICPGTGRTPATSAPRQEARGRERSPGADDGEG